MSASYSLPSELTIYAANAVRTTFQEWVRQLPKGRRAKARPDKPLVVDAANVMEIDAAGLQLLIALARSVAVKKHRLELSQPSQTLRNACTTFGLVAVLLQGAEDVP